MVKHGRKRSSKNFVAIPVDTTIGLSTLSENNVILGNLFSGALTEDLFAMSADLAFVLEGTITPAEGPLGFGAAHEDYSAAEVAECLNVAITGPGDKIALERLRRLVRRMGRFPKINAAGDPPQFNEGRMKRVKLNFIVNSGKNLNCYVQNQGAGATTGRVVTVTGMVYGRWLY